MKQRYYGVRTRDKNELESEQGKAKEKNFRDV